MAIGSWTVTAILLLSPEAQFGFRPGLAVQG